MTNLSELTNPGLKVSLPQNRQANLGQGLMPTNKGLPAYPNSWFAVALSDELPPGKMLTRQFMGQDLIIFRTQSGAVSVLDPFCPHLGAHIGHGGTVEGEAVRCPFHGFCFDAQGNCVATGYGTKPPPKAKMRTWLFQEKHGLILVYYHNRGNAPDWEVPELDTEGWSPLRWKVLSLSTHPQEIYENSVDVGHFSIIHNYDAIEDAAETVTDGPNLYAHYAVRRRAKIFGKRLGKFATPGASQLDVFIRGLGYSLTEVKVPEYGVHSRLFVLVTPADNVKSTVWLAFSQKISPKLRQVYPALRLMPQALINAIALRVSFWEFTQDLFQDLEVWENKCYVQRPALAEGDGPISKYRNWVRQFYPQPVEVPA